jgi:hypothetical protein
LASQFNQNQQSPIMESTPLGPPLSAHLIASPADLTQKGKPNHPSGLIRHECIGLRRASTGMVERWELRQNDDSLGMVVVISSWAPSTKRQARAEFGCHAGR